MGGSKKHGCLLPYQGLCLDKLPFSHLQNLSVLFSPLCWREIKYPNKVASVPVATGRLGERDGYQAEAGTNSKDTQQDLLDGSNWYGSKIQHRGTANFSPEFHLPGSRFGYLFLTHSHRFWLCPFGFLSVPGYFPLVFPRAGVQGCSELSDPHTVGFPLKGMPSHEPHHSDIGGTINSGVS